MEDIKYALYVLIFCSFVGFALWMKNGCLYDYEELPNGTHSYRVGLECKLNE